MLYLVKTIDTREWDEEDPNNTGPYETYFRNSSEEPAHYHVLNEKEYGELMDQCIPDDPEHYTKVIVLAKVEREDLIGLIKTLVTVPNESEPEESPCDGCYPNESYPSKCNFCEHNGN